MADVQLKQNDLYPIFTATLRDGDGAAVSIQGATIRFSMRPMGSTTPAISLAAAVNEDNGVEANRGKMRYEWQTGDTATPGFYEAEIEALYPGSPTKPLTFPNGGYFLVHIKEQIA